MAKSIQSCPSLCNPIDGSPPGSPVPGILQARTLEWVAISFSSAWKWKVRVKSLSRVQLFATPWTTAFQAPSSMGFFQTRVLEWGAIAFSKSLSNICKTTLRLLQCHLKKTCFNDVRFLTSLNLKVFCCLKGNCWTILELKISKLRYHRFAWKMSISRSKETRV